MVLNFLYYSRFVLSDARNFQFNLLYFFHRCLVVSYGTGSHKSTKYEVLVANNPFSVHWVPCSNGSVSYFLIIPTDLSLSLGDVWTLGFSRV